MIATTAESATAELPLARLDRRSAMPYHAQLRQILEQAITSSLWRPADRLPSEQELCRHFGVSRSPVRQALADLEADGLIRREKGRGTFVAEPPASAFVQSTASFHEEATRLGHTVRSEVLTCEVADLPNWAAHLLTGQQASEGLVLERLRYLEDEPVMLVKNYLPARYADAVLAADLEKGSLYQTLRDAYGVELSGGRRTLSAAAVDAEAAPLLGLEAGDPVLVIESVAWDDRSTPIEAYIAWHRSEHTRVEVQVIRRDLAERAGLEAARFRTRHPMRTRR